MADFLDAVRTTAPLPHRGRVPIHRHGPIGHDRVRDEQCGAVGCPSRADSRQSPRPRGCSNGSIGCLDTPVSKLESSVGQGLRPDWNSFDACSVRTRQSQVGTPSRQERFRQSFRPDPAIGGWDSVPAATVSTIIPSRPARDGAPGHLFCGRRPRQARWRNRHARRDPIPGRQSGGDWRRRPRPGESVRGTTCRSRLCDRRSWHARARTGGIRRRDDAVGHGCGKSAGSPACRPSECSAT